MPSKDKYDLIIIGAGVLGTFSAYHALKAGLSVALIERNNIPRDSTVRNFGQIVPSGLKKDWKKYGRKSLELYKELQAIHDFSVRPFGSYYLASCEDELTLLHELSEVDAHQDYSSILMSGVEACERIRGLRPDYCQEALFYPDEVSVDPRRMIYKVLEYLIEQFKLDYFPYNIAQHFDFNANSDCQITTNTNFKLCSEQILLCNGSEYQVLFPEYYKNEDIECVKIQMLLTKPQPSLRFYGNILTGLSIRRYEAFKECPSYASIQSKNSLDERIKKWGIHLLFKQTDAGQVIIGDSHQYADAHQKEELGFDISQSINDYILDLAGDIFNLETYSLDTTWTGVYSQAKNEDIITGTIEEKIHILNAIGGKGMTAGPGYCYYHIQKLFGHD